MPTIAQLLGTKNRKDQEKAVAQLLQSAGVPVIDLVIRYDPRSGLVDLVVVGVDAVPFKVLYNILDDAHTAVRERQHQVEKEMEKKQLPLPGMEGSVSPPTEQ